ALLDADTLALHSVTVRVTDINSQSHDEVLTIRLADLAEDTVSPTDLSSGVELNMDGRNDAYLIADDGGALLGGLTELTFETTFSTQATGIDNVLVSFAAGEAFGNDFLLFLSGSSLRFYVDGVHTSLSGMDYSQLADGEVHSLAVSWDNSNGDYAVYVDGALVETGTGKATGAVINGSAGSGELVFGQEQETPGAGFQSNQIFSGTLYDVRLWDQVRSAAEIALNYSHKLDTGSLPTGLVANWQMDGFNGSNEIVEVVSANNLSIGNATTPLSTWSGLGGGVTSTGSTLEFDPASNSGGWGGAQAYSSGFNSLGYTNDYTVSFTLDRLDDYKFMVGLGLTESSGSFTDIDHAVYFDVDAPGDVAVYKNGSPILGYNLNHKAGDEFSFYVNGTSLEYKHNGVTFHTETVAANENWYLDTAFHGLSGTATAEERYSVSNIHLVKGDSSGYARSIPVSDLHISENSNKQLFNRKHLPTT
ncbi:MAG: LamG-like jellyroll fold domain-containing protein, partial [Pseudomonadota bacterium]